MGKTLKNINVKLYRIYYYIVISLYIIIYKTHNKKKLFFTYWEFFISSITLDFNVTYFINLNFTTVWNNYVIIWSSSLNFENYLYYVYNCISLYI